MKRLNISADHTEMLISKFIINLPPSQLKQDRIWIHLQRAYFFYLDEIVHLQEMKSNSQSNAEQQQFASYINSKLPSSIRFEKIKPDIITRGHDFVPIAGVLIVNKQETKVLLVEALRTGRLGLPKGKIDQGESFEHCAQREVREEVGINIKVNPSQKYNLTAKRQCIIFVYKIQEQCIRPEIYKHEKMTTAKEIKAIHWIKIQKLDLKSLNTPSKLALQKFIGDKKKQLSQNTVQNNDSKSPLMSFTGFDRKKYEKIINA